MHDARSFLSTAKFKSVRKDVADSERDVDRTLLNQQQQPTLSLLFLSRETRTKMYKNRDYPSNRHPRKQNQHALKNQYRMPSEAPYPTRDHNVSTPTYDNAKPRHIPFPFPPPLPSLPLHSHSLTHSPTNQPATQTNEPETKRTSPPIDQLTD